MNNSGKSAIKYRQVLNRINRVTESSEAAEEFGVNLIQKAVDSADAALVALDNNNPTLADYFSDVSPEEINSVRSLLSFIDDVKGMDNEESPWKSFDAEDGVSDAGNFNPSGIIEPTSNDPKDRVLTSLANAAQYCSAAAKFVEQYGPDEYSDIWVEFLEQAGDAAGALYDSIRYDDLETEEDGVVRSRWGSTRSESTEPDVQTVVAALESFANSRAVKPTRTPSRTRRVESGDSKAEVIDLLTQVSAPFHRAISIIKNRNKPLYDALRELGEGQGWDALDGADDADTLCDLILSKSFGGRYPDWLDDVGTAESVRNRRTAYKRF